MYKHLSKTVWTRPDSYFGHNPEGDFVLYVKTRDSHILDESNFDIFKRRMVAAEKALPPDDRESLVTSWTANHWACGWIEYLMLSKDSPDALKAEAESILESLSDYPVLDEEDYSRRQDEIIHQVWKDASLRERVEYCREAGYNRFAARDEGSIPSEVYEVLSQKDWTA